MNIGVSRGAAAAFWRSMPLTRAVCVGAAVFGAVVVGLGCESGRVQPPAPSAAAGPSHEAASAGPVPAASGAVGRFGAALEPGATVPLASLLSEPKAYANKTITTEGRVQRACSRKGCWMEIGSGEDSCRITFKDYGFFVPTDSAGAFAKVQGRLDTREVEAAAVEHLESEGARFRNKRSDGSATEVRMIASAVELRR
jgi:hypothetical protein